MFGGDFTQIIPENFCRVYVTMKNSSIMEEPSAHCVGFNDSMLESMVAGDMTHPRGNHIMHKLPSEAFQYP